MQLPHLSAMLKNCFHQDYFLNGDNDEEIIANFAQTNWPADVLNVYKDLESILSSPTTGLKDRLIEATCFDDYEFGKTDQEVEIWLIKTKNLLKAHI